MYPLDVILIAHDVSKLPEIRRELLNHGAIIENETSNVNSLKDFESTEQGKTKLFLLLVTEVDDLGQLRLLRSKVNGQPILAVVASRSAEKIPPTKKQFEALTSGSDNSSSEILPSVKRGAHYESERQSTDLFVAAMRAGAQQVVSLPLDKDDFSQALDCLSIQFGTSSQSGNLIAVATATEGCGATTLAVNLAYELGTLTKQRCILTEARLHLGMLAPYLNLKPELTLHDVLDSDNVELASVKKTLTDVGEHLAAVCGPYQEVFWTTEANEENTVTKLLQSIECMKRLSQWVVIAVPATFDTIFFQILDKAHSAIIVVDQSIVAFHHLQRMRATLALQNIQTPILVVVNKFVPQNKEFSMKRIQEILIGTNVESIALDPHIPAAMNLGEPLRLFAPKSPALHDFNHLARIIAGLPETSSRSWLSGILHKT